MLYTAEKNNTYTITISSSDRRRLIFINYGQQSYQGTGSVTFNYTALSDETIGIQTT